MNGAFAAAILMAGVSVAHAQEDTLPVRQNVYGNQVYQNQVSAFPGGYYPQQTMVYPGMYPGAYPG
ncbi:hypothetical protein ACLJCI_09180, partial [Campylobacter coli]